MTQSILELPAKTVTIKQLGGAEIYWQLTGIDADLEQRRIILKGKKVSVIDSERIEVAHNFLVTNETYRVPVVDGQGNPVLHTVLRPTGQYKIITPQNGEDAEGNPVYGEPYADYTQPIMEEVSEQKTVGEFDMWFKKIFEPILWPAIKQGAMANLNLLQTNPLVYQESE